MTDVTPQESARIISHMNKDHSESLSHYLTHYGKIPSSKASQNPVITEFTTPLMKIEFGKKGKRESFVYRFEEPMLAGQARKRLEEMHQEARKGCGISEVTVNSFWPMLDVFAFIGIFGLAAIEFAILASRPAYLSSWFPWAAGRVGKIFSYLDITPTPERLGYGIKALFIGPFYFMHGIEACTVLQKLFRKYNTTDKTVRLQWIVATIIGGLASWGSFQRQAEKQERELEEKKEKSH